MALFRLVSDYKRRVWLEALEQKAPRHIDELPRAVDIHMTFISGPSRDADAHLEPKWTIDALKAKQRGKAAWRCGLAVEKGFLVDDDPKRMRITGIQHQRSDNIEQCVVVKITPRED